MNNINTTPLLSRWQAADYLKVKETIIAQSHCTGYYNLPSVKIGRRVNYRIDELEQLLKAELKMEK